MLLVEGEHDKLVLLEEPFRTDLAAAGIVVQPFRGVNQFSDHESGDISELVLESVLLLAHGTIGIMFDNDASPASRLTHEQKTINRFIDAAVSRGLHAIRLGLNRPDIVTYLNPDAIKNGLNWEPLLEAYRRTGRSSFKNWLWETDRIDLRYTTRVEDALRRMRDAHLPFEPELVRKIKGFSAAVMSDSATRQLGASPD